MADATDGDATEAVDPADATIARLLDFADSGNYDRDDVVRFVDFEERILCQDFRAATRANGRVWRDVFHSRLAVARCEVSVARFVDALFRAVAEVPGAFAPWDAYKNDAFYKETRARLVSACCQPEASAYHEVARKMWHLALPDHVTQRKICLRHLHVLRHFQSLLDDPEAVFFQHETLEELVSNPPAQFVESLRSRNVHLDDLAHCLPGFVSPNVAPVSTRTFQLAAAAFLERHKPALHLALVESIAALKLVRNLPAEADDLDALEVQETPERDTLRCPLPEHLYSEARALHLRPGPHSHLGAAIPSFRVCLVLRLLCNQGHLVPSAMRVHDYVGIVRRIVAEREVWAPELESTPPPTPAATPAATPAPRAPVVATPVAPTQLASVFLDDLVVATGARVILAKRVGLALQRDPRDAPDARFFVADIVTELMERCPSADTHASLTQKVAKELRDLAAKAGGSVVSVSVKGKRRRAVVCDRAQLEVLRDVTANVR